MQQDNCFTIKTKLYNLLTYEYHENFSLIKKNLTIIIIALILITILLTGYCLVILLNLKVEITTIIQFLGVTVALIVGMITALFSWDNTQNVIEIINDC